MHGESLENLTRDTLVLGSCCHRILLWIIMMLILLLSIGLAEVGPKDSSWPQRVALGVFYIGILSPLGGIFVSCNVFC